MARATNVGGDRMDYLTLASSDDDFLEEVFLAGTMPDPEKLVGWEFKGFNSLDVTPIAGVRKFKKGFYRDGDEFKGYNVKVKHNGLIDPWIDIVKKGESVKHGWYDVYPVRENEVDKLYSNALLLNYACEKNPKLDPSRILRDYLVLADPENPDIYVAKAYAALGPKRIFVSYFVLCRENPNSL